jgi:shikimate dehydrogenase
MKYKMNTNNQSHKTTICMVIGDPVAHSLSPNMHNAGYKAYGIAEQYTYLAWRIRIEQIPLFLKGVRSVGIRGVSCTVPHKIIVMPYLDKIDPIAKKIGAVNTIVNDNHVLTGYNTDWIGISKPLEAITSIQGKTVALLGAGGAARAAAYAITQSHGKLIILNRTAEKAQSIANDFGGTVAPLDDYETIQKADIIINTTTLGLHPQEHETPIPKKYITKDHIVFDCVYGEKETRLLKEAQEQGARVIHGREMLLHQGTAQFTLYTKRKAPEEIMRKTLL